MFSKLGPALFFGIFAIAGLAAFIGSSYSPVVFWLQNGYWDKPPSQILFGLLFLVTHGGIGFGGLCYFLLKKSQTDPINPLSTDEPWLNKHYWCKPDIDSNNGNRSVVLKFSFYYSLVIAIIALFVIFHSIKRQEYIALLGLIAPAIAYLLYYFWKKSIRETLQFGPMSLAMNPYPGSIGNHLGGTIDMEMNDAPMHNEITTSKVQLLCVRYYNSGDDSKEESLWNESMVPSWQTIINGHQASFVFNLDEEQFESEPSEKRPYIAWKIIFTASFKDGRKIKRIYEDLPVFKTMGKSTIRNQQAFAETSDKTLIMHQQALDRIMPFKSSAAGNYHLYYPMGRSLWSLMFIFVGLFFVIIGLLIPDIIFNIAFPAIGGIAALAGIYALFNAIDINIDPIQIVSKQYLFGILIKTTKISSYEISEFIWKRSHSTSTSNKTTQYYDIYALSNSGKKALIVEGVIGMGQAREAINRLKKMMNIEQ